MKTRNAHAHQDDGITGKRWEIRIIKSGLSLNNNYYSDRLLASSVPLFEGVRVFIKSDKEHLSGEGKSIRNLIGKIDNVQFLTGTNSDTGELVGTLHIIDPQDRISQKIKQLWENNMSDLFGFSIDAQGTATFKNVNGKRVRFAEEISKVHSVDLIIEPGAGGQIINLIESKESHNMSDITHAHAGKIIDNSILPLAAKSKFKNKFLNQESVLEAELREAIKKEVKYLSEITSSGTVQGLGEQPATVQITESQEEKSANMLDAFFDTNDKSVVSIRECYLQTTGDKNFTGSIKSCDQIRLREALGSQSFPDALGDAIARRLIKEYQNDTIYDVWKKLVNVVPVTDFRDQHRTRFGGYGDLPIVAESDPYTSLSSPTDEKATYAVEKRGGIEELTLEMITNDDVGAVQRIPTKLVRSAKRTLSKFVLDTLKNNPVIYDGLSLFHTSHNNLGTSALDGASVATGRLAMKSQTEKDSHEKLGISPRYLWVPDELEETAVNLFRRNTEQDRNFVQSLSLEVIPVWYWDDVNDWCLTCDPNDLATVELGFLRGNEEPELFIQDNPTIGSMFTNDKTTYKIRHIYGGTVLDYRGAYKSVVA